MAEAPKDDWILDGVKKSIEEFSAHSKQKNSEPIRETLRRALDEKLGADASTSANEKHLSGGDHGIPQTWDEAIPYAVWIVIVLGFGLEFVGALVRFEWVQAIISFVGMVVVMGAALHWARIRSLSAKLDGRWLASACMTFLIVLSFSPFIEQRRWPFTSTASIENSGSIPMNLPTSPNGLAPGAIWNDGGVLAVIPNAAVPIANTAAFVNPLHSDAIKWRVVKLLIADKNAGSQQCQATIVRYQLPYAEDYAADMKEVLTAAGWRWNEIFATATLPRGVSLRVLQDSTTQDNVPCANLLSTALSSALTREGRSIPINSTSLPTPQSPEYLKNCPPIGCVEINIGNED